MSRITALRTQIVAALFGADVRAHSSTPDLPVFPAGWVHELAVIGIGPAGRLHVQATIRIAADGAAAAQHTQLDDALDELLVGLCSTGWADVEAVPIAQPIEIPDTQTRGYSITCTKHTTPSTTLT